MNIAEYSQEILKEIGKTLSRISTDSSDRFAEMILDANRVFVAGAGRSGLMIKAFANRLMQIGIAVYVVGETITPAIAKGDLLIIGSGSGKTESLINMAGKAWNLSAKIAVITIYPESPIGKLADVVVEISASTPKAEKEGGAKSIQPMGNLFEQSLLIFLDCIAVGLMERTGQEMKSMYARHANLE